MDAYNRAPSASAAVQIAEQLRARGSVGGAANWAERALACPNQGTAHRRAHALLRSLHWPLRDANVGLVEVTIEPERALISVDEVPFLPRRGRYRLWLHSGAHQLVVTLAGFASEDVMIDAKAGEERSKSVHLRDVRPAVLELDVRPVTAEVWIDGTYHGLSTRRTFPVRAGLRMIEVRADGFTSWTDAWTLVPDERKRVDVILERAGALRRSRPAASNVERPLTPLELANKGERHDLGRRPHDRLRAPGSGPEVSGTAEDRKPREDETEPAAPGAPRAPQATPQAPEQAPVEIALGADEPVDAPSAPLSAVAKGALWVATGAVFASTGAGMVLYGIGEASDATEQALQQRSGYRSRYDAAANLVYAGYGAIGAGAIAAGVGGLYLFGSEGLGRKGRGWLLAGVGGATATVGAVVMVQAGGAAELAAGIPVGDPRYDALYDGATQAWQAGLAAAVIGGAMAAGGAFLLLTSPALEEVQLLPSFAAPTTAQASAFTGLRLLGRF